MTTKTKVGAGIFAFCVYMAFGVYGWLGSLISHTPNPDGTCFVEIYARSPLLLPFARTYSVDLPSQNDLNSHTVFEASGMRNPITIEWRNPSNLVIVCSGCLKDKLIESQVDSIRIELVKK